MSNALLAIRHAKRSDAVSLDLSGQDLKELPKELFGLGPTLEILNLSNNKLSSIDGINQLTSLKELNLTGNLIKSLSKDICKCSKLKLLVLEKNPIISEYPYLKKIDVIDLESTLDKYFGETEYEVENEFKQENNNEEIKEDLKGLNEEQLKKLINELRNEIKGLKLAAETNRPKTASSGIKGEQKKELFSVDSQKELENEKTKCKKLELQLESMKNQLAKVMAEKTLGAGTTLEGIQGVTEIDYSELKIEEELGKGGFAIINKGKWRGTQVAIKRLFDPNVTEAQMEEVRNEILTMATLRHPKITMLLGICRKPPNIAIVMECCKSTLFALLHKSSVDLPLNIRLKIARDIASAYTFMHASGIVHRDLKSLNILIMDNNQIRLCDFGLARYKADLNKGSLQFSGTPAYMALEIFQKKPYDEKVDVFAFGTLLWEIVSRKIPYDGLDADLIRKKLEKEGLPIPYNCPAEVANLINLCRSNAPEKRPTFDKIYEILEKAAN